MGANLRNKSTSVKSRKYQICYDILKIPYLKEYYDMAFDRYLFTKGMLKTKPGKDSYDNHMISIALLESFQNKIEKEFSIKTQLVLVSSLKYDSIAL